jgi:hypothetical protein
MRDITLSRTSTGYGAILIQGPPYKEEYVISGLHCFDNWRVPLGACLYYDSVNNFDLENSTFERNEGNIVYVLFSSANQIARMHMLHFANNYLEVGGGENSMVALTSGKFLIDDIVLEDNIVQGAFVRFTNTRESSIRGASVKRAYNGFSEGKGDANVFEAIQTELRLERSKMDNEHIDTSITFIKAELSDIYMDYNDFRNFRTKGVPIINLMESQATLNQLFFQSNRMIASSAITASYSSLKITNSDFWNNSNSVDDMPPYEKEIGHNLHLTGIESEYIIESSTFHAYKGISISTDDLTSPAALQDKEELYTLRAW